MRHPIEAEFLGTYNKLGVGNPKHSDFPLLVKASQQRELITRREERVLSTIYWILFESFQKFGWYDEDPQALDNVVTLKGQLMDTFGPLGHHAIDNSIANAFLMISQTKAFANRYLPLFYDSPLRSLLLPRSQWLKLEQYFPEKVSWKKGNEIMQAFRTGRKRTVRSEQFRLCQLHFPAKGNVDSRAYLTYWAVTEAGLFDPNVRLKRKVERCPKRYKTRKEVKELWFNRFKSGLDEALKDGWSPFLPDHLQPPKFRPNQEEVGVLLVVAIRKELKARIETFPKSKKAYNTAVLPFLKWLESTERAGKILGDQSPNLALVFTREDALAYRSYLKDEKRVAANGINSYLTKLKAIFEEFMPGKHYELNPFNKLKLAKEETQRNKPYSISQGKQAWEMLKAEPELLLMVKLIYHCFLRVTEVVNLRAEHLHLDSRQIFVSGDIAKGGREKWVILPPSLSETLQTYSKDLKGNERLFLNWRFDNKSNIRYLPESFEPTPQAMKALFPDKEDKWIEKACKVRPTPIVETAISRRYNNCLQRSGFEFNGESFYSWKHTGMISALLSGYNMVFVSGQAGHSDYSTTQEYLKRYPKGVKHDIFQAWPEEKIDQSSA